MKLEDIDHDQKKSLSPVKTKSKNDSDNKNPLLNQDY